MPFESHLAEILTIIIESLELLKRELYISVDPVPNCFLGSESQRQVDSVQSHPVNVAFPLGPLPEDKGISGSADVLIVPESVIRFENEF